MESEREREGERKRKKERKREQKKKKGKDEAKKDDGRCDGTHCGSPRSDGTNCGSPCLPGHQRQRHVAVCWSSINKTIGVALCFANHDITGHTYLAH